VHGWCVVRVCVGGNGCFVGLIVSCDEGRVICTGISSNSYLISVFHSQLSHRMPIREAQAVVLPHTVSFCRAHLLPFG